MKVLFYDDTLLFGGHETTALAALRYLGSQPGLSLGFAANGANQRLIGQLRQLREEGVPFDIHTLPFTSATRFDHYLAWCSGRPMRRLRDLLQRIDPDVLVAVQGSIGTSFRGILAARRYGCRAVSFIPMAHTAAELGAKLGPFRDYLNSFAYRLPDAFITQNSGCRTDLVKNGVLAEKIHVTYYGLDPASYPVLDRALSRQQMRLEPGLFYVASIARIEFQQKGQDVLIKALVRHRDELSTIRLLIVGDGPDLGALQDMIRANSLQDMVQFIEWRDDLAEIFSAVDAIVLPSRFEGLPVTLLQAMHYGVPIVGSAISGIAEILPAAWLFEKENPDELAAALLRVKNGDYASAVRENQDRIRNEWTMENYGRSFHEALQSIQLQA